MGSDPHVRVRGTYSYVSSGQNLGWVNCVTFGSVHDQYVTIADSLTISGTYDYSGFDFVPAAHKTRVAIDPNVRVRGNSTYAGFEDVEGPIAVGDVVEVYESESGLAGEGKVTEIDSTRKLVYLSLDWSSLTDTPSPPSKSTISCGTAVFFDEGSWLSSEEHVEWTQFLPVPCLAYAYISDVTLFVTGPARSSWGDIFASSVESALSRPYVEIMQPYANLWSNRMVTVA